MLSYYNSTLKILNEGKTMILVRWMLFFGGIFIVFSILTIINYWQIDNISNWASRAFYALKVSPILISGNLFIWFLYSKGYKEWFGHNIWQVQIIFWASGVLVAIFMNWWWYDQMPSKGTLVAIPGIVFFSLLGILWK